MSVCIKLKEEYLAEIKQLEEKCKTEATRLKGEEARDEAILENIKLNIVDIFTKMFNISFSKACKGGDEKEQLSNLKKEYMNFFEKIPAPWRVKMVKDQEHNMMEEYYKEKLKLEMVDTMKGLFMDYYEKYYGEI